MWRGQVAIGCDLERLPSQVLVANQSDGNSGGVTLSKFLCKDTGKEQGPHKGAGSAVAPTAPERLSLLKLFSSAETDPI
jgi:hypothetical protein